MTTFALSSIQILLLWWGCRRLDWDIDDCIFHYLWLVLQLVVQEVGLRYCISYCLFHNTVYLYNSSLRCNDFLKIKTFLRARLPILQKWTHTNIPGRQKCVQYPKSQKSGKSLHPTIYDLCSSWWCRRLASSLRSPTSPAVWGPRMSSSSPTLSWTTSRSASTSNCLFFVKAVIRNICCFLKGQCHTRCSTPFW